MLLKYGKFYLFLASKSDENKLTNPYQIRKHQRCEKQHFGYDILWISFTFSWLAGYCQTDSGVSDVEMFLPSKSDVNKLTNPYQIRKHQRCEKQHFGYDILWISFTFSWLAGYCQTDSGVSDVEMFLPSKSDVNKLTNPYQIRIQQRCDRIENHFVHNSLVSFSNYVSIVKLHTFAIYSANDDFCFFMKKKRKIGFDL